MRSEASQNQKGLPASFILSHWLGNMPALIGLILVVSFTDTWSGGPSWAERLVWALLIWHLLAPIFTWSTFRYSLSADMVCVRTGLLNRRTRSASWDRVSTVQLDSPWAYRLVGAVRVTLLQGGDDATKLSIPCLPRSVAEQMLARAEDGSTYRPPTQASTQGKPVPEYTRVEALVAASPTVQTIYSASVGDLVLAGLIYGKFAVLGGATAFALVEFLQTWGLDDEAISLASGSPLVAGVIIAVAIMVFGMVATVVRFAGLQTTATTGGGIKIRYGLFTTRERVITPEAVCGIELRRNLLEMALGRIRLSVTSMDSSERLGSNLVLPSLREDVAARILSASFASQLTDREPLPSGAWGTLRAVTALIFTSFVAFACAWAARSYFPSTPWLALLALVSSFILIRMLGALALTQLQFSADENRLSATTTWISARQTVIESKYVYFATLTKSWGCPAVSRIHYYAGGPKAITTIRDLSVVNDLTSSITNYEVHERVTK